MSDVTDKKRAWTDCGNYVEVSGDLIRFPSHNHDNTFLTMTVLKKSSVVGVRYLGQKNIYYSMNDILRCFEFGVLLDNGTEVGLDIREKTGMDCATLLDCLTEAFLG